MTNKVKVVGYCRFSSSNQREESITAQKRFISMYADNHNMEIVDWYADHAKTGKTVDRPEFQRLLADVKNHPEFQAIIVHKFDRFSRNTEDTLHYKNLFRDYGVDVISISENVDDTPAGRMMLTMMSSVNQYYLDNLSLEVMKGLKENALQCKWTGGPAPLGYDLQDGKLFINEQEAKSIRLIFEMAADGYGYGKIVDKLNLLGYRTKAGNSFGKNSLYEFIRNERYKGTYIFNRRAAANSLNKRNNHRYKPDSEIIRIENGCPAIVSKALWERANAVIKSMRHAYTNARHPYLLTGLLYCDCGGKFHGNIRRRKDKSLEYTTYRCSHRTNKHTCATKEIRCSILDSWIIEQFINYFFNDDIIPVITKQVNEKLKRTFEQDEEFVSVKRNLEVLEKSRKNLINAIAQTGSSEVLVQELKRYENEIGAAKDFIESHKHNQCEMVISENDVREKINQLKDYMSNPENLVRTKYILTQYIERIDISNETVKVTFKVTFSISDEKQLNPTVYQSVSIKRKRLMSHYSDRSAFSDINRIIEKHVFSLMRGEFLKTHITRKSHDCIYNRDFHV